MSSFVGLLLSSGGSRPSQQLQHRNETSHFNPARSPFGVIDPLLPLRRKGLIAVSSLASVSLVATFCLVCLLTYRFIFWRRYYRRYIGYNQYIVLVYNLALADIQQGLGFIVSLRWIATNSIHASDAFCFLQGVWLQIGDPMSGMFVLAIAVYTFLHVILGYQLSHRVFVAVVVGLWVFGVVMVVVPIATVGRYVWLPAVAWCWITIKHPELRLWTHYFWIFAAQFFMILLYAIMFIQLRRRIAECVRLGGRNTDTLRHMNRVVSYMVLYPVAYIILTLPLAAGRMAAASGHNPSITYYCVAGSLMTLSGLCDTLLYTLTRKHSVLDPEGKRTTGNEPSQLKSGGTNKSTKSKVWSHITNNWGSISAVSAAPHRSESTNESVPNGDIELMTMSSAYQEMTIDVPHEQSSAVLHATRNR